MSVQRQFSTDRLARGLGWFSIGLGLAELIAPRRIGRRLGLARQAPVLRTYGMREIATGAGILAASRPTNWLWGRVAGDVLDLATLAPGMSAGNRRRGAVGLAIATVAAVTLIDLYCAARMRREDSEPLSAMRRD